MVKRTSSLLCQILLLGALVILMYLMVLKTVKKHGLYSVHYAHAATGELHLRPILNLKTAEGTRQFRTIAEEIAALVKKYRGSLSGEHGDGRLRGGFLQFMIGERNFRLLKEIKQVWDPENIFNQGKIFDSPKMNSSLRYNPKIEPKETPNRNIKLKTTLLYICNLVSFNLFL